MSFLKAIALKNQKTQEMKISEPVVKLSLDSNENTSGSKSFLQVKFQGRKIDNSK